MTLTASELRSVIQYDPGTGAFVWRPREENKSFRNAGQEAGCIDHHGYRNICVKGKRYPAHRLAWLYVYGAFPVVDIDHRDRDRGNNRIDNLRPASQSQNAANASLCRNNTSGIKGVRWEGSPKKPWRAVVKFHGKNIHIGMFADREEAGRAYLEAATRLFGEFATDGRG